MWKKIRIAILLFILFLVAADTYMTKYRAISWDETLWVAIYPINVNQDSRVQQYIDNLTDRDFVKLEEFFVTEAKAYNLPQQKPFRFLLAHKVDELPPAPPEQGSNIFSIAWWSLRLRYWAFMADKTHFLPHIKIFVIYHSYEDEKQLAHSLGMEKGMIGVVHAYAHRELEGKNALVISHEVLHTIGASDKYDLYSGQPLYPDGYAEPDKQPRFPQLFTELMGGRTPLNETESVMPRSLDSVRIGEKTALEINWISAP